VTLQEVVEYCLSFEGTIKRYPFGKSPLAMTVKKTKGFCDIYEEAILLHIVVKCDPEEAQILRGIFE
jgi:predicted DNA-binding protein (MmcQ/YjbR family)